MINEVLALIDAGKSDADIINWYYSLSSDEIAELDCEIAAVNKMVREAWLIIQKPCELTMRTIRDYFVRNGLIDDELVSSFC